MFQFPTGARDLSLHSTQTGSDAHADSSSLYTGGFFSQGVKWPGREIDILTPSSAEV